MSSKRRVPPQQTCERHREEPIMVFSLKHEKAMCLKCAMLEHDQISDFIPVSEGAQKMRLQGNKLIEEIRATENIIKHIRLGKNKYLERLRESEKLVKDGIKSARENIIKTLNKLESKALAQLKHAVKTKEASFAKFKQEIYNIEDDLKNMYTNISNSLKSGNELSIISTVVKEKNLFQETKAKVSEKNSSKQTDKMQFRTSAEIRTFLETVKSFGEVSCSESEDESKHPVIEEREKQFIANNFLKESKFQSLPDTRETPSLPLSPVESTRSQRLVRFSRFRHGYETRHAPVLNGPTYLKGQTSHTIMTAEHDGPCNHTGIAALSSGCVVICDARHKCLQLISRESRILDDIIFHCKPCDVTTVSENEVAVSFHEKDYISLFNISEHKFVHIRDLSVSGRGGSYSIAHSRNKFAVCRRGEIRIISGENGAVLNVIQIEAHYPQIAFGDTDSRIYLSDFVGGKIVCLTETGKHRWEYSKETLEPTGIAIDLNQLYVTDVNGKILVLSTYGILVREIECIGQLNALSIDRNTGILLVTQESKEKTKSRMVKIVTV